MCENVLVASADYGKPTLPIRILYRWISVGILQTSIKSDDVVLLLNSIWKMLAIEQFYRDIDVLF